MNNKPNWPDDILRKMQEDKCKEMQDDVNEKLTNGTETEWEDLPPQVQYAIKAAKARQRIIDLLCQRYTKDQTCQLMRDWNHEFQPLLEFDDIQQMVDNLWLRYDGLYPPPESKMNSVLFKSEVADWGEYAWNKLLDYFEDWEFMQGKLVEAMQKHTSCVEDGQRLRDFLGGYFLMAKHEAPSYVINAIFESLNEIASPPPSINKDKYDSGAYTMLQAITIDVFVQSLYKNPLIFIDVFDVQDTGFIRNICAILTLFIGLMDENNDK